MMIIAVIIANNNNNHSLSRNKTISASKTTKRYGLEMDSHDNVIFYNRMHKLP